MKGDPQKLNVGTAFNAVELLRDLAECCSTVARFVSGTCTCESDKVVAKVGGRATVSTRDIGIIDKLTNKPDDTNDVPSLQYRGSGSVKVVNPNTGEEEERGFVIRGGASVKL